MVGGKNCSQSLWRCIMRITDFLKATREVLGHNFKDLSREQIPESGWYTRLIISRGAASAVTETTFLNGQPVLTRRNFGGHEWDITRHNPDGSALTYAIRYSDGYKQHRLTEVTANRIKKELISVVDEDSAGYTTQNLQGLEDPRIVSLLQQGQEIRKQAAEGTIAVFKSLYEFRDGGFISFPEIRSTRKVSPRNYPAAGLLGAPTR